MRGKQGPPVDSCASASRTVSEHWLDPIPATERPFGNSTGGCDRGHCHILPALDDSAAMAAQAAEDGIEVVCATPHIRPDHLVSVAELPLRVDALRQELRRRGLDVEIALGGEVAQTTAAGLSDSELRNVSLGGGGWVLVEPDPGPLGDDLSVLVQALAARGVPAVVAHPERHAGADFEKRLRELTAGGA